MIKCSTISVQNLLLILSLPFLINAQPCNVGSFRSSSGCQLCPVGTYSNKTGVTQCTPCPSGTALGVTGGQSRLACLECSPGTFAPTVASEVCQPCPHGTNSTKGATKCQSCPAGKVLPAFPGFNNDQCESCFPSSFQDLPNQRDCKMCPGSFTNRANSPFGSTSIKQCKLCPVGTSGGSEKCFPCSPGTVGTKDGCGTCPPGTFNDKEGATECTPCPIGQISVKPGRFGTTGCSECADGFKTFSNGQTFCRKVGGPCPPGYLEVPSGDCVRCDVDQFYSPKQFKCLQCPTGTGSAGGLVLKCNQCRDVLAARITESICSQALSNKIGTDEKGNCLPGTFRNMERSGICESCPPGTFSGAINAEKCSPCVPGTIQPESQQSKCIKCPSGSIAINSMECLIPQTGCPPISSPKTDEFGDTVCQLNDCSVVLSKTIFQVSNVRQCNICGGGSIRSSPDTCENCANNEVSFDGKKCEKCPNGLVRSGGSSFECSCRGLLAENVGIINGKCTQCPPGAFGKSRDGTYESENVCVKCPAGTFRKIQSADDLINCASNPRCALEASCPNCPPDSFTDQEGSLKCKPCPPGTFTYGIGETKCLKLGASSEPVEFDDPLPDTSGGMKNDKMHSSETTSPIDDDLFETEEPTASQETDILMDPFDKQ